MKKELLIALLSPALHNQCIDSKYPYPKKWKGKVPLKVKMLKDVESHLQFFTKVIARKGHEYYVWVNSYGAVAAIFENGKQLGLKPNEFEVIEWHKQN